MVKFSFQTPDNGLTYRNLNSLMFYFILCEKRFSAMTAMKTKYKALLNIESDLRLKLTNIEPEITSLVNNKQAQPSH